MPTADTFQRRLDSEFGQGRLRVRWSNTRQEWQIEQKVGRAKAYPLDEYDDEWTRARDGYSLVMRVTRGTKMACPRCRGDVEVPALHTAEVKCPRCSYRSAAAYYPLDGDALMDWLRFIDPSKGRNKGRVAAMDQRNAAQVSEAASDASDALTLGLGDDWRRLFNVPRTGYTGPQPMWQKD